MTRITKAQLVAQNESLIAELEALRAANTVLRTEIEVLRHAPVISSTKDEGEDLRTLHLRAKKAGQDLGIMVKVQGGKVYGRFSNGWSVIGA